MARWILFALVIGGCKQPAPRVDEQQGADMQACWLMPCHGLELRCERSEPPVCTELVSISDACRSLAACREEAGRCQLALSPSFESCRACVEGCRDLACAETCRASISK